VIPGVTIRKASVKRASSVLELVQRLPGHEHSHDHGLATPGRHLEGDAGQAGVVVGVGLAEVVLDPRVAVPRRDLGEVDRGLDRFALAEEEFPFPRRIAPVCEQAAGRRRDVHVSALAPAVDALSDAIDFRVRADPIERPLRVEMRLLPFLPRAGDRHEEGAGATLLVDVGGDAVVVEPEMPAGRLERRIQNRVFDGDLGHAGHSTGLP